MTKRYVVEPGCIITRDGQLLIQITREANERGSRTDAARDRHGARNGDNQGSPMTTKNSETLPIAADPLGTLCTRCNHARSDHSPAAPHSCWCKACECNAFTMSKEDRSLAMLAMAGQGAPVIDPPASEQPIAMLLHCPICCARHIDEGEFATKRHHTHACQSCGHVWRPAIVATVGVRFLPGFKSEAAS